MIEKAAFTAKHGADQRPIGEPLRPGHFSADTERTFADARHLRCGRTWSKFPVAEEASCGPTPKSSKL